MAIKNYEKEISQNEKHMKSYAKLGCALKKQFGEEYKVEVNYCIKKASELNPGDSDGYGLLADMFMEMKEVDKAME